MSLAESHQPTPQDRRLPRRKDRVISAPKAPECVDGEVIAYVSGRVSIRTAGKHGNVSLPLERFTWSPRRRAWICWPQDVIRALRKMDQDEPMVTKRYEHARIGELVMIDGRCGWVKSFISTPFR
jgi:hypothetical protein